MIHSVAGMLDGGRLVMRPPFREPHHSASQAALTGGGQRARPGEVSLAHRGVLFLDELPEFPRPALDSLRQPMESRPHHGGARRRAHHLSGAVPAGRGDEPVPLRLSRRRGARMRPRAALRRGLPEPRQRPGAGSHGPDGGGAAGHGRGTRARAARRGERRGRRAGGPARGRRSARATATDGPLYQRRGRHGGDRGWCRTRRRWRARRWTSCACRRAATRACCGWHAASPIWPARESVGRVHVAEALAFRHRVPGRKG